MANIKQEYVLEVTSKGLKEIVREIKALRKDLAGLGSGTTAAEKGFSKVSKSAGELDRNMKGAAKATNNSTKGFSKMAQGMQGTLVPAYATVAANVFALTAAFGALERAADTQILIKASEELAVQTGRSLTSVAASMKDITGSAISMKEALTSASIAASAGFDNSTIEQLTQVARNASVALGRDMTDSLNRVFKGAIKAEPELLDELGIILRLDPAARKYAAAVGKTVQSLTTFEKQQAVVNEVIAQGQQKFDRLSEIDPNPYTQLSASFTDLVANLLKFVNIGVGPIINALADNVYLLAGAFLVFGNSVAKRAFPILEEFGSMLSGQLTKSVSDFADSLQSRAIGSQFFEGISDSIKTSADVWKGTLSQMVVVGEEFGGDLPKGVLKGLNSIKNGVKNIETQAAPAVEKSLKLVNRELATLRASGDRSSASFKKQELALLAYLGVLRNYEQGINRVTKSQFELAIANGILAKTYKGLAAAAATAKFGITEGFRAGASEGITKLIKNTKLFGQTLVDMGLKSGIAGKSLKILAQSLFFVGGAMGSVFKAIPIIGQLIVAWQLLGEAFKFVRGFFTDNTAIEAYNDALDKNTQATKQAIKSLNHYNKNLKDLPDTITNVVEKTQLLNNILRESNSALKELIDTSEDFTRWDKFLDFISLGTAGDLGNFRQAIQEQVEELTKLGELDFVNQFLEEFGENIKDDRIKEAAKYILEYKTAIEETNASLGIANQNLLNTFSNLAKTIDADTQALPKLKEYQVILLDIEDITRRSDLGLASIEQLASGFEQLSNVQAAALGITEYVNELSKLGFASEDLRLKIKELNEELAKTPETAQGNRAAIQQKIVDYESALNYYRERSAVLVDRTTDRLEEQSNMLRAITNAEINLNKIRVQTQFALSRPNLFLEERIDILRDAAAAEANYYNTISFRHNERLANLEKEKKAIEANSEALKSTYKNIDPSKGFRFAPGSVAASERAQMEKDATNLRQIESEILREREAIKSVILSTGKSYVQLLKEAQNILFRNSEYARLGIPNTSGWDSHVINIYNEALLKAYDLLKDTNEEFEDFKIRQTEILESSIRMKDIFALANFGGFDSVTESISNTRDAIDELTESYALQQQYANFDELINAQEMLKSKILETTEVNLALAISQEMANPNVETAKRNIEQLLKAISLTHQLKLETESLGETKKNAYSLNYLNNLEKANKLQELELKKVKAITKAEKIRVAQTIAAYNQGLKGINELTDEMKKKIEKGITLEIKIDRAEQLKAFSDEINPLKEVFTGLSEALEENETGFEAWKNSFMAAAEVANELDMDPVLEGLSKAGFAITEMFEAIKGGAAISDSLANAMVGVGGALKNAFEEGSKAAKAAALVEGIGAVIKAWNIGFPQNIPVVAVTVANVAKLLSQMGESADLGSAPGGGGSTSAEKYTSSFGEDRISGMEYQNSSWVDSIDNLTMVNDALFGAEKELKRAIYDLKKSIDNTAKAVYAQGGSFSEGDIAANFGRSFGTQVSGNQFLWASGTETSQLLAAGLEFGASIQVVAGEVTTSLEDAALFITEEVTKTKTGLLGRTKTSTDLKTSLQGLSEEVSNGLIESIDASVTAIISLMDNFGSDVESIFDDYEIKFPKNQLNLMGLSAEEQGNVIAAYLSGMGNTILKDTIPWIDKYRNANEDLLDTLIRLVNETMVLNDAFSITGSSIDSLARTGITYSGYTGEDFKFDKETAWWAQKDVITSLTDAANYFTGIDTSSSGPGRNEIGAWVAEVDYRFSTTEEALAYLDTITSNAKHGILSTDSINADEAKAILTAYNSELDAANRELARISGMTYEQWLKDRVAQDREAWKEALKEAYGGSLEDFAEDYRRFAETAFTPEQLQQQAIKNAQGSIDEGFTELETTLAGRPWAQGMLSEIEDAFRRGEIPAERLGEFYLDLEKYGFFAGEAGAALLEEIVGLGVGFADMEDATESLANEIDNFLRDINREIALFGLSGKQSDLLQLEYEFQDRMEEASEKGAEAMLAVETLYGLKRIEIIKGYHEDFLNEINAAYSGIDDAMLSILRGSEAFNEVAYQSLKIETLKNRLAKSFNTGNFGSMRELIALITMQDIDTSRAADLDETLRSFLTFSEEIPGNVSEQIQLANELKDSIMDRYNAEEQRLEDLKSLTIDIKGYLDDLLVGDLSPLTNLQRFNELSDRFAQDLVDVTSTDNETATRAAQSLLDNADSLLTLGSDLFAIGPKYQDLFDYVYGSLKEVGIELEDTVQSETELLSQLQINTLAELDAVNAILTWLQTEEMTQFEKDILYGLQTTTPDAIKGIENKLGELDRTTWGPSLTALQQLAISFNKLPSKDVGDYSVPFDQLAMIHQGEMIIPAEQAQLLRNGETSFAPANETLFSPAIDNSDVVNAINILTQVVAETQEEIIDQNGKVISNTKNVLDTNKVGVNIKTIGMV